MISKRNFKMYIKQKSTITAFLFFVLFLIMLIISVLPACKYRKGVYDEFKSYDITYMSTNNYNVTYLASGNELFYSQNKKQTTSLNTFVGLKDLSNAYGDPTARLYNFVRIDHKFSSDIIEVQGIMDDIDGTKGETLILTKNSELYLISQRSNKVQCILKNVKAFDVKYEPTLQKEIYLVLHHNNDLSLYYIENSQLNKMNILNENIEEFYFVKNENNISKILIKQENKLYELTYQTPSLFEGEIISNSAYPIYSYTLDVLVNKSNLDIECDKFLELNEKYYYLKNNKVYKLDLQNNYSSNEIICDKPIDDFYATGEDALIAICDGQLHYYGTMEDFEVNYESFTTLNIKNGRIYANANSVILLKENGKLYLYNDGNFDAMYTNLFITIILRYFSIFALSIMVLYFIISFIEDNKRFNRYFKFNK